MNVYDRLHRFLKKNDFITLQEANQMGVSKMMLSRMVKAETLHRSARSIYTKDIEWMTDPLRQYAPACTLYPDAVVCGISALTYYDLTDEFQRKIWLAFPREHRIVNREYRITYPRDVSYNLGIVRHKFGTREVRIYDREKTVVDAFKLFHTEVAMKALKRYLQYKKKDIPKLVHYSRILRKPLNDMIMVLMADG